MSKVTATYSGFVPVDGVPVQLQSGDEYEADHPLVQARPELFTEPEPEPVKPAAKAAAKATTAKPGAKDG
jgi:hypothetical protein